MKDLYVAGMWILIMLIPYSPSWATIFSNPETGSREVSGDNATPVVQCTGDVTLSSQAEVDAFPSTYGCTEVMGFLTISGADIVNVDSLYLITAVGGLTVSGNDSLTNLDGLSGLSRVEYAHELGSYPGPGVRITNNPVLSNISGLASLRSVGADLVVSSNSRLSGISGLNQLARIEGMLVIEDNESLSNLDGLSVLQSIGLEMDPPAVFRSLSIANNPVLKSIEGLRSLDSIPGWVRIFNNYSLPNLNGLERITELHGLLIVEDNTSLKDIDGLSGLSSFDGQMRISGNRALKNLDALTSLTTFTGSITIRNNTSLANVDGFSSLVRIGGRFLAQLTIDSNPSLTNLDGLSSLTQIGENEGGENAGLVIQNNASLINVDGLSSLIAISADRIWLRVDGNTKLTRCCGLFPLFENDGLKGGADYKDISISGNGAGCTEEDIRAGGPCESSSDCPEDQLPQDKYVFAENESGYAPHSTNILINDYEPGILYELRRNDDNSNVAGPQPGYTGLFAHNVIETTEYNVLARNPETGCGREIRTKVTVTIAEDHMAAARIALLKDVNKEGTNRNVTLYPNPGNGEFNLEVTDDHSGLYYLYVHDLSGRVLNERTLLKEGKTLNAHFDLKPVTGGATYMLSIYRSGGPVAHKKLIIAGN